MRAPLREMDVRRRSRGSSLGLFLFGGCLAVLAVAPPVHAALPLRIEAENYVASYNAGGDAISVGSCSSASGFLVALGVDAVDDWVECAFTMASADSFRFGLASAGNLGETRQWLVEFYRATSPPTWLFSDTLISPPGGGIG
jgi:hypothetical protein